MHNLSFSLTLYAEKLSKRKINVFDKRMVKNFFQTPSSKMLGRGGGDFHENVFFKGKKIFPENFTNVFYTILYDVVL